MRENDPALDTCLNIVKAADQHAVYISNSRDDGDATETYGNKLKASLDELGKNDVLK